jgi:peroxiredoxin/uncharacterized membrane protein YphA (DoxX/SURF4 family)
VDIALLLARLLLAVVFILAGLAKLFDRAGSRQALIDFGVPSGLASALGVLLPLTELAVAIALVAGRTAWWGAIGALALLVLFVAGIGLNLARGRKPDCHCFGQLHSEPVGWSTLARNGILAAVAGFVVWQGRDDPGASPLSWVGRLTMTELLFVVGGLVVLGLLVAEGWFLFLILRQNGRLLVRLDALEARIEDGGVVAAVPAAPPAPGLPVGSPAPAFALSGLYGETLTLEALRAAGKPVLLLFTDPHCGPCNSLMPDIGRWQREQAAALTVAVISRGGPEANRAKSSEHGLSTLLLQQDYEVANAYQAHGTPGAVVVRPDGTIGSPVALGPDQIRELVARTVGGADSAPAAPTGGRGNGHVHHPLAPTVPLGAVLGQRAPEVELPDLGGRTVSLADFRGRKTLVLFWNPGCGFCQRMLPDLQAWEDSRPTGAPQLLVVSTGDPEANRAQGIRSPVVMDHGFGAGSAFGANGTPSAVLVDEHGNIASGLAVGAPQVMALANGQAPGMAAPPQLLQPARVGDPAPELKLPDLDGRNFDLAAQRGSEVLVLFWNPGCGFCQQMLPDLKAWEDSRPPGAPELLVVSSGSVADNRAMGLRSRVVLDGGSGVIGGFGANGTPMAVLVDAEGRIASPVAAGAQQVFELANRRRRAAGVGG